MLGVLIGYAFLALYLVCLVVSIMLFRKSEKYKPFYVGLSIVSLFFVVIILQLSVNYQIPLISSLIDRILHSQILFFLISIIMQTKLVAIVYTSRNIITDTDLYKFFVFLFGVMIFVLLLIQIGLYRLAFVPWSW